MRLSSIAGLSLGLIMLAGAATAADWRSGESGRGAWTQIEQAGLQLHLSCNRNDRNVFFSLSGGPFNGMKNRDDVSDSMMMWIEMSDGRTARHPIDGHYFAPDRTFIGRFLVSDIVLDQFRRGATMRLTAPTGATIAEFGMRGTGKARGHFKQACRI